MVELEDAGSCRRGEDRNRVVCGRSRFNGSGFRSAVVAGLELGSIRLPVVAAVIKLFR